MLRTSWLVMTRRGAALLALAAFSSLGCLVGVPEDTAGSGGGKGGGGGGNIVDDIDVPQAYFTLDGTDLRRVDWPQQFNKYSVFVCTPSLGVNDVAKIHDDIPGALALSYTNVQDVPLGMYPGNPYYEELNAAFDSTLCLRDLHTGNVIRQHGESGSAMPSFIISTNTADILIAFLKEHMTNVGWDGIYVDQCTSPYPDWRKALLDSVTTQFDIDGDGIADSMAKLDAQYNEGRPYFTRRLREELGAGAVIVGNAGGSLVDSYLNGITLEGVGTRFTIATARDYLNAQKAVSRTPFVAALWITTDGSREPSLDLAREIAGVHYGTVAYFQ